MSRDMIEIVDSHLGQANSRRATFEAHTWGGGSDDHLLFRISAGPAQGGAAAVTNEMFVDRDDARMLFNWLGAWLHKYEG